MQPEISSAPERFPPSRAAARPALEVGSLVPFPCRGYQELASPGFSVATSEDVSLAAWGCSSSLADSIESEAGSPQGEGCWGPAAAVPPLLGQGLRAEATMLMLATAMHPPTRRWPRCRQPEDPSAPWGG